MREKTEKGNAHKIFFVGILILVVAYSLLWLAQSCSIDILKSGSISVIDRSYLAMEKYYPKYSVPFPINWCFVMEWFGPLLLCISYAAMAAGEKKIYFGTIGMMAAGLLTLCFGEKGLKAYSGEYIYVAPSFCHNPFYWSAAEPKIGKFLPLYFVAWFVAALLLMVLASKIMMHFSRSRSARFICPILLFLFALSEGILFNRVYFGQYTFYYIARSILILLPVLFTAWHWGKRETGIAVAGKTEKAGSTSEEKRRIRVFQIGMGVCLLLYVCAGIAEVLLRRVLYADWKRFLLEFIIGEGTRFLFRHFTLFLAVAGSVYTVKSKRQSAERCVLAVICGTAFLVQEHLSIAMELVRTGLAAWCMILFLLLTFLWKDSKRIKIIFNVFMYMIIIAGIYLEQFVVMEKPQLLSYQLLSIIYIVLYLVMLGITLYALMGKEDALEEIVPSSRKGFLLWVLLLTYVLFAVLDNEIVLAVHCIRYKWQYKNVIMDHSVLREVKNVLALGRRTMVMYSFPFMVLVSYLAHAMQKKRMQFFCSMAAFTTMFFLSSCEIYHFSELGWNIGLSVTMIIMMVLLFLLPFLTELFPRQEKMVGAFFMLVTYGILFCNYVLPLTAIEICKYCRYLPYVVDQVILLTITIVTLVLYGKKSRA